MDIMLFPNQAESSKVTHICLLGDDPTVNITPVIDKSIPSHRVIIACTESQLSEFKLQADIIRSRGYKAEYWLLPDTNKIEELQLSFMALFEKENSIKDNIWLNISNGLRSTTLIAYEVARAYQIPIFIVDPKSDELYWLFPEKWPAYQLNDKIKLHEFLKMYGCDVVSQQNKAGITLKLRELGAQWLCDVARLSSGLKKLNFLASIASGSNFSVQLRDDLISDPILNSLLDDLHSLNLIEIQGSTINFLTKENKFFANGGWLEECTFGFVRGLRSELKQIQDDGHSVEISRLINKKPILNELDVVALVNNKLHVIECKTKTYKTDSGTDTLYKLNSLAERLGGIKARAALVTYYPVTKADWRRAKELDITIIADNQLTQLKSHLKNWFEQS